jgi:hypothetical protein
MVVTRPYRKFCRFKSVLKISCLEIALASEIFGIANKWHSSRQLLVLDDENVRRLLLPSFNPRVWSNWGFGHMRAHWAWAFWACAFVCFGPETTFVDIDFCLRKPVEVIFSKFAAIKPTDLWMNDDCHQDWYQNIGPYNLIVRQRVTTQVEGGARCACYGSIFTA